MDDYRKSYEYEEESGVSGILLLFVVMLLVVETLLGAIIISELMNALNKVQTLSMICAILSVAYIIFDLFTCFALFKLRKIAVRIAKAFLTARVVFWIVASILTFAFMVNREDAIGTDIFQFHSVSDMITRVLIFPIGYALIFSAFWYIYLLRSEKVKTVYGRQDNLKA